ncbi:NADH-ubiquinone/plastoquinone oxidoreductase [Coemansia reversa NRRL 1564]|uniref:NADH-ubiquinone/plastoquinone oxidoreductase n=1 Tax=Coemansia reversa (strain ATCC 12441 / NRRL 1564) TaxID=763665 RepID=A0A2G5B1F0_COERN|nr:NADH-ubiquinone/plastoquinone oxidoreductase [Coemansia reversa NRRL 1564]|eukprot:PIA12840.1 NADH-ubiquinone/plastoquinone oxidoreductase [Coemansia reversa NRRL 1564]
MNEIIIELVLICGAVLAAIFTLISVNPIYSVISLIMVFLFSGSYLLILSIGFIGLAYFIIYIGAISILFLFAVMMLDTKYPEFNNILKFSFTKYLPFVIITLIITVFLNYILKYNLKQIIYNFNNINIIMTDSNNYWQLFDYFNGGLNIIKEINYTSQLWDTLLPNTNQIKIIAYSLYTNYAFWLIIMSLNLLLAMIGPIALCFNAYTK